MLKTWNRGVLLNLVLTAAAFVLGFRLAAPGEVALQDLSVRDSSLQFRQDNALGRNRRLEYGASYLSKESGAVQQMNRVKWFVFDHKFWQSVNQLDTNDSRRVREAIKKFQQSPDMPGLNLEQLKGTAGKKRLCTFRASDGLRVLLARIGHISVFLRAGHHDAIYRFADRTEFVFPHIGIPGLIATKSNVIDLDGSPIGHKRAVTDPAPDRERSILEHWKHNELTQARLNEDEIRRLRRSTQDTLLEVWPNISQEKFDQVLDMAEQSPDEWFQLQLIAADDRSKQEKFRKSIEQRGARGGLSSVFGPEEFQRLMSAPIEDWMIFLHPDQRELVDRRFSGPARVRGAAGTGKTVVALHRAAALAKRYHGAADHRKTQPILFTTFIKSLPPVFENLYRKLPTAVEDAVEFINIDKLAFRICCESGQQLKRINKTKTNELFDQAFAQVVRPGTPLYRDGLTRYYLRDEVNEVLKGRGVESLDEYLELDRTGRRARFTEAMRKQTWDLRQEYDRHLDKEGFVDFPDRIRRACNIARQLPEPTYRAAIVDESQDITLVGLQLIRALVSGADAQDRTDALFIVGDGAQKIYPGGFTLAQAGLDVRGNSAVLRVNYRNTREIIETAMACAGSEPVDDLGDRYVRGDAAVDAVRNSGVPPCIVRASKYSDQVAFVVKEIQGARESQGLKFGDIGIFAATNEKVDNLLKKFRRTRLSHHFQKLRDFTGQPHDFDFIKIGTFHRAKGLEFKMVFLFGISEKSFPKPKMPNQSDSEYNEQRALQVSELFVAMTRARDRLFLLSDDKPSLVLYDALDHLKEVKA